MLINLLKTLFRNDDGSESDPESVSWTGSLRTVNQFFRLIGPIITPTFNEILHSITSTVVEKRSKKFVAKYRSCENVICKFA